MHRVTEIVARKTTNIVNIFVIIVLVKPSVIFHDVIKGGACQLGHERLFE